MRNRLHIAFINIKNHIDLRLPCHSVNSIAHMTKIVRNWKLTSAITFKTFSKYWFFDNNCFHRIKGSRVHLEVKGLPELSPNRIIRMILAPKSSGLDFQDLRLWFLKSTCFSDEKRCMTILFWILIKKFDSYKKKFILIKNLILIKKIDSYKKFDSYKNIWFL